MAIESASTATAFTGAATATPSATATFTLSRATFAPPSVLLVAALLAACSSSPAVQPPYVDPCASVTCTAPTSCIASGSRATCVCGPGYVADPAGGCTASIVPSVGGCNLFPADHLFNTPIDALPVHPSSATFLATIGDHALHLDLGTTVDMASDSYWGIPFNVVNGDALAPWPRVYLGGGWPDESDCADASAHGTVVSPCTAAAPVVPVPASPLVEGGINTRDEDHHILVVDADRCRLWEVYHATPHSGGGWDVLGAATWDLRSSALRPAGWTSADAAGFPILPLLLRAAEAQSGTIRHALRFTIPSGLIRHEYTWPARHLTGSATSASLPPMGQLFRLRAAYQIPATASVQSRAILQALKTYGMYLADGGSSWYVQGEPSAAWDEAIYSEVQAVRTADLEAVDLSTFTGRSGWSADSARVPGP